MPRARGLLLDVGVVFFKSAWEIADDYERLRGLPAGTVEGRGPLDVGGDALWQRYLDGEITERDYWLTFAGRAQDNGAPLDGHPTLMRAMFQQPGVEAVRPEGMAVVEQCIDAGVRVGILTNELMDFQGREWVESQPWFDYFPVLVDSTRAGCAQARARAVSRRDRADGTAGRRDRVRRRQPDVRQGRRRSGCAACCST